MTEKEFLIKCRELMDSVVKGHDLCLQIQDGINDDYRNGRITYEEWERQTKENENKRAFFMEQFDLFSERFKRWNNL